MPGSIPTSEEVADLLHSVNRRIRTASHGELGPIGLTPGQWRALRTIAGGSGELRMSELADRLRIARRSATSVVDDLVERNLVVRRSHPQDRRAVIVELTVAGRELVADRAKQRRRAASRRLGLLSDAELHTLRDLLRRLDQD